jgi:hypothetical protein
MKKIFLLSAIALFFVACEPEIDDFKPIAGNADFSAYVAIGNSLTAGYADGDLYKTGQENSYPAILAGQFATVGGGDFKQPLMVDNHGFGNKMVLGMSTDCLGQTSLAPVADPGALPPAENPNFLSIADQGPFNNMGVPGAKSFHLLYEGYGQLNPYFGRFMSTANTSVLADAMAVQPTFFTLWIGNNDALGYALAGGEADSITDPVLFQGYLDMMLQQLTASGAQGAMVNIPDITTIPFFNTVLYNALPLTADQADQLNAAYAEYNAGADLMGVDHITFAEGANALVIEDETLAAIGGIRQIKANELVLLTVPQDSIKCAGWGSQKPVPAEYVLDAQEINEISGAIADYNAAIKTLATTYQLAFVDMAAKMTEAAETGFRYDGVSFGVQYVTGGLFSLDGIHLTPQGYAIVANEFIDAINTTYGATVPKVNAVDYPGITFP